MTVLQNEYSNDIIATHLPGLVSAGSKSSLWFVVIITICELALIISSTQR